MLLFYTSRVNGDHSLFRVLITTDLKNSINFATLNLKSLIEIELPIQTELFQLQLATIWILPC